jgi:hypothetical protein
MLETAEACKILGVSSDAGRNEIEKRYSILLKKHRMADAQGENDSAEQEEFNRITEAYNFLMGYEEPVAEDPRTPNPLLLKMGIDEKKTRNFFYYYKYHMLIGLVVLLAVVFTVKGCVERVDPDFTTVFIGEISYADTDKLYAQIKEAVPEIKEPGFDGAFITASGDGPQDYAMLMKAAAITAAGGTDLFIIDRTNFEKYAREGAFVSLDDIAARLGIDSSENKDYVLKSEYDPEPHLYGIGLSGSKELEKAGIRGAEMIAAIPASTKKQETAVKLIEYLIK